MDENSKFVEPYKPSWIHTLYRWVDRLPGPYWLFSIAFIVLTGLLNLIVAWKENVLPFGEINWYYATTGFFFAYFFFATDFLLRTAKNAVLEFLTILDADENKSRLILSEFTHLPARNSGVIFILGAIVGFFYGRALLPTAPEMNYAFPELEVTMYSISIGMVFVTIYAVLRASRLIGRLFEERVNIDIFDQTSLYAISRYSAWLIIVAAIPTFFQFVLTPSANELTATFLAINLVYWLLVLIVFWVPLRRANGILVSEKRRLLRDVNLRIRTNFDMLHAKMDNHEYENIADIHEMITGLQIERESIKSIGTWPWQASTLTALLGAIVLPALASLLFEILDKLFN
jgi:hypothetical protein